MRLFSLKEYGQSKTSAPELVGDVSTGYGKKQIHKIAEFNGLTETMLATDYATVVPFGVDFKTAACLQYIYDILSAHSCCTYITECGEVYATREGLEYSYLDNNVDSSLWEELGSYGNEAS